MAKIKPRKLIDKQSIIMNALLDQKCHNCGNHNAILGRYKEASKDKWSDLVCRECFLKTDHLILGKLCKNGKEYVAFKYHFPGPHNKPMACYNIWMSIRLIEKEEIKYRKKRER